MSDTFAFIKKLQQQPKDSRRKFGFAVAGIVTVIIFVFWIATIGAEFDQVSRGVEDEETDDSVPTPLETVSEGFATILEETKEQFSNLGF